MASTTTPSLPEWLVIVPDYADALDKRMASRPQHIEDLKKDREDMLLWGGMFMSHSSLPFSFFPSPTKVQKFKITFTNMRFVCLVGAMLHTPLKDGEPPQATGSAMLIGAKTREEVVERLQKDVYVKDGVWDWEKVQIIPFRSAIRKAL
jgi:uncharacterized protein YciI